MDKIMRALKSVSLLVNLNVMTWNNTCGTENCSGHGECYNGSCICEIQFDGSECGKLNSKYFTAFATIFFTVAFVCLVQLIMCIVAEWKRMKAPSILKACRITTQKVLYFVVFLASIIRGAYFVNPSGFVEGWSRSLLSAYYPLLLSGSSLIVCFWAEVFHLRNVRCDRPQFLSKSFLGFAIFNVMTYSLLLAEFIITQISTQKNQSFYTHIFNGCYAVLLFIVVMFFLFYGVEVFFKVRGGFLNEGQCAPITTNAPSLGQRTQLEEDPVTTTLFEPIFDSSSKLVKQQINTSQLHQSRFGLLVQALMLFIIVGFLFSEVLGEFWKTRVPLYSRNCHDIVFRVIEVGVVLWFPCVLWNCVRPERLWILNPKRILEAKNSKEIEQEEKRKITQCSTLSDSTKDCWICYDSDRQDAGSLIQPCRCRGDVSTVHHDCLRRWLVESTMDADNLSCKVCRTKYQVERAERLDWQNSMTQRHLLQSVGIVVAMCGSGTGAWLLVQFVEGAIIKMIAVGSALLITYVCIRCLSVNTVVAYQRAKISSLSIVANVPRSLELNTINHSSSEESSVHAF